MKIYHNPRCRKSRETLQLIEEAGKQVEIVEYLKEPPSKQELGEILQKLGMKAEDIVRKNEDIYKSNYKGQSISDDEWLGILLEHPKLMERPIVVDGDKAILGRPPENVKQLL